MCLMDADKHEELLTCAWRVGVMSDLYIGVGGSHLDTPATQRAAGDSLPFLLIFGPVVFDGRDSEVPYKFVPTQTHGLMTACSWNE